MLYNLTSGVKIIKPIKITDVVLIAALLAFAAAFYFIFDLPPGPGGAAVIKINGEVYAEASLDRDQDIEIYNSDGKLVNIVRIKDGKAAMVYAACPDKRCTRQTGHFIVCLPNRVTVETVKNKKDFDIII